MTSTTPPDGSPLVSVLLVTYNSAADLDDTLTAVQRQQVPGGYELVAIDNASTDGSADLIEAWAAKVPDIPVQIVRNTENVGYAAGNNQAFGLSRGRILLLLNPDAAMDDGCLHGLVEHLWSHAGVGAVAATLRNPDGTLQESARRDLTLGGVLWDLTLWGRRHDRRRRQDRGRRARRYAEEMARLDSGPLAVDCPAAACTALWREFAGAALFDERLPLFFNDAKLFGQIRDRHYRCEIVPSATAVHGYGTSHRRIDQSRKRAEFVVAMRRYAAGRFPIRFRVALTLLLVIDGLTALGRGLLRRERTAREHARGTLGGLWLAGGATPWLSRRPGGRQIAIRARASIGDATRAWVRNASRRHRRRRLIGRIRRQAWLLRAPVDLRISRRAQIDADVRVELKARRRSSVIVEDGVHIADGVLLRLWGGDLHVGAGTLVRHGAVLVVKGRLDLAPRAIISRDVQLHADGTMVVGFGATVAERTTVVDTTHTFDDVPTVIFDKPVEQADVTIGNFAFVGSNSVVTRGVTIGDFAVVAPLSVVRTDVPDRTLVAGAPATTVRRLRTVAVDDMRRQDLHRSASSVDRVSATSRRPERSTRAGAPAATE